MGCGDGVWWDILRGQPRNPPPSFLPLPGGKLRQISCPGSDAPPHPPGHASEEAEGGGTVSVPYL